MHARITTAAGVTDIDRAVGMVRDHVLPQMHKQHGHLGISASANRANADFVVLSLWETEADMHASESTADKVRQETMEVLGAHATVERFEQPYQLVGPERPGPGSRLQVRRITVDLARLDENVEHFTSTVGPGMGAMPGFQAVRLLLNRQTGEGVVGAVWKDDASLRAATAATEESRRQATAERGVRFGEVTVREILFVSMP